MNHEIGWQSRFTISGVTFAVVLQISGHCHSFDTNGSISILEPSISNSTSDTLHYTQRGAPQIPKLLFPLE
jgi:hypothetical protein